MPLASGLLSGRYTRDSTFAADDHRSYNRHGAAFDVGETFSGVYFEAGVDAAREFAALAQPGGRDARADRAALGDPAARGHDRHPGGTQRLRGARQNSAAADLPVLDGSTLGAIENLYDKYFRAEVHARW